MIFFNSGLSSLKKRLKQFFSESLSSEPPPALRQLQYVLHDTELLTLDIDITQQSSTAQAVQAVAMAYSRHPVEVEYENKFRLESKSALPQQ